MRSMLVAGLGLPEIIMIAVLFVLLPFGLVTLVVAGITHFRKSSHPNPTQLWPLSGTPSPFQLEQAVGERLRAIGIAPWRVEVDAATGEVRLELLQGDHPHVEATIRSTLAPFRVDVVRR